jgi:hypothetical protein
MSDDAKNTMPDDAKNKILAACRGLNRREVRELLMLRTVNKAFRRNVDQVSADHVSSLRTRTSPRLCWILSRTSQRLCSCKKKKQGAPWRSRR